MSAPSPLHVAGVGRAVLDHAVLVPEHPAVNSKAVAIDRWRGAGSPVPVALCQLSRWGWRTGLQAVVGDDPEGERVRAELVAEGVNVDSLQTRSTARTPLASIWVEAKSGRRTVVLDRDLDPLSPDELSSPAVETAQYLLLDGWEESASLHAASMANETGVQVVLDAGGMRSGMDQLLKCVDWLIVPVSFVLEYLGKVDLFAAVGVLRSRLHSNDSGGVVITNGAGGCVTLEHEDDTPQWFRSYPVKEVDTTGAGDVFHAGFIHGLLSGWKMADCVRWAAAAAAHSVTALGARGGLGTKAQVIELLSANGEDGPWTT